MCPSNKAYCTLFFGIENFTGVGNLITGELIKNEFLSLREILGGK